MKDRLGDIADVNNYRGITLSPVISKLFEYCVLDKYYIITVISSLASRKNWDAFMLFLRYVSVWNILCHVVAIYSWLPLMQKKLLTDLIM